MSNLPALISAIVALVTAVTALIALFRHASKPGHKPPG